MQTDLDHEIEERNSATDGIKFVETDDVLSSERVP
jgi:hypothetical protein